MALHRHIPTLLLLLLSHNLYGAGKVVAQTQPAQIQREKVKILTGVDTPVKMYDEIETLNGTVHILFEDDTKVSLSKYSKLVVDEYVYDSNKKVGKVSLKGRLGTLRYTSGKIAKNNRKNVKITSPTASVSVRGTDFTMTVEPTGKTTFQLLPSIDASGNAYTGSIAVSNSSGVVVLNQAFEVTRVDNNLKPPSPPKKEARQAPQDDKPKVKEDPRENNNNNNDNADEDNKDAEAKSKTVVEVVELFKTNPYDMSKVLFKKTTEQGNVTSLNIDATSDATINYLNNGIFQSFFLNNGNGVIFNIEQ
jgi:hypothetical protein